MPRTIRHAAKPRNRRRPSAAPTGPGADAARRETSPGADVARGEPSPGADVAGTGAVQCRCHGRAQSRCRCGRGEPSPGHAFGCGRSGRSRSRTADDARVLADDTSASSTLPPCERRCRAVAHADVPAASPVPVLFGARSRVTVQMWARASKVPVQMWAGRQTARCHGDYALEDRKAELV